MFNVYFQTENGIRVWHGNAHDQHDAFNRAYRWVIDNGNDYIVDFDIEEEAV
jgi:hypothetical protein